MSYNEIAKEDIQEKHLEGGDIDSSPAKRNESHFDFCKRKYAEDVKNFNIVKCSTIRSGVIFDRKVSDIYCG